MTDSLYVNAYTTLGVAEDVSSNEIKAAYRRRLVELQNKQTQPHEYALLVDGYNHLVHPGTRAEIDQDLARQRAERNIVVKPPAATKRRYDFSDPTVKYGRLMASAKTSRTLSRTQAVVKYDRACREADDALISGRSNSLEHEALLHLTMSAYQTKLDAIEAKFAASAAAAAARCGLTDGTVPGHALEETA